MLYYKKTVFMSFELQAVKKEKKKQTKQKQTNKKHSSVILLNGCWAASWVRSLLSYSHVQSMTCVMSVVKTLSVRVRTLLHYSHVQSPCKNVVKMLSVRVRTVLS